MDEVEAKADAEANSHETEAKIVLTFSQILHFDLIFSTKNRNFRSIFDGSIFDGTSKISAQNGLLTWELY